MICQEGQRLQTCPSLPGLPSFNMLACCQVQKLLLWLYLCHVAGKNHVDDLSEYNHSVIEHTYFKIGFHIFFQGGSNLQLTLKNVREEVEG
jgi:hypothetical protein